MATRLVAAFAAMAIITPLAPSATGAVYQAGEPMVFYDAAESGTPYNLSSSPWVRSGDGSSGAPFIIAGWEVNLTAYGNGSMFHGVGSHVILRENHFYADGYGAHAGTTFGVDIYKVSALTIEGNLIERMRQGVTMHTGDSSAPFTERDVRIINNDFLDNTFHGIRLFNARNFTISGNRIEGTGGPPIEFAENTAGMRVFHNNLLNNSARAVDAAGALNAWDDGYPSGGNYWTDYNGTDRCRGPAQDDCTAADGIGDAPYPIDADSEDRYPLMAPYERPNSPPVARVSMSPPTPVVNETVTFNASTSFDVEGGSLGLEFRFDLDGDGLWDGDWGSTPAATVSYSSAGERAALVQVRDAQGAMTNATVTFVVGDPGAVDPHPATAILAMSASVDRGHAVEVEADVSDPEGVASVQVVYQGVGASTFTRVPMEKTTSDRYRATLPTQTAVGILEFYLLVTDANGHQTRDPPQGTHTLTVREPDLPNEQTLWDEMLAALYPAWLLVLLLVVATAGVLALVRSRRA